MSIGSVLGGPLGKGIMSLFTSVGKGLFKLFIDKPKLAKKALKAGIDLKNRADVAKAKLAKKDPAEVQSAKLRRQKDKQAEYDIVNAMDVQKLTSEASRLNTIKARAVDLGEQRFISAMSSINRSTINTGKLKSSASQLANTSVPINDIPKNTIQNNITMGNMTSISNSASSLTSIAAQNPEAKPIADLGQVITQQNMTVASMNTENAQKLGEMIRQSTEISTVNSQALMQAENNIIKLTNTQNTVISDTASVVANVQDELPNALNNTAESLTQATAGLIKKSTDMEKDAIVAVSEDITDKINTLGASTASANALIIRNDNQGTDQVLEAVSDGNLLVESKLNAMLVSNKESGRKWSDVLKIGKEILRDFLKEQLVSIFEVIIGIKDLLWNTPLFKKLRIFLDTSADANDQDAIKLDEAKYSELEKEYQAMLADPNADKEKLAQVAKEMANMKANDSKWHSKNIRDNVGKITGNFLNELNVLKTTEWWIKRKDLLDQIVSANQNNGITQDMVEEMHKFMIKYADHRYNAWNYVDRAGGNDLSSTVYDNNDLESGKEKDKIINGKWICPPDWIINNERNINLMILCYAEDGKNYKTIHLDDYFFASYNHTNKKLNVFERPTAKFLAQSLYHYMMPVFDEPKASGVINEAKTSKKDYINYLIMRTPKTGFKFVIDILERLKNKYIKEGKDNTTPIHTSTDLESGKVSVMAQYEGEELARVMEESRMNQYIALGGELDENGKVLNEELYKQAGIIAANTNKHLFGMTKEITELEDMVDRINRGEYTTRDLVHMTNLKSELLSSIGDPEELAKLQRDLQIRANMEDPDKLQLYYRGTTRPDSIDPEVWDLLQSKGLIKMMSEEEFNNLQGNDDIEGFFNAIGYKGDKLIANDVKLQEAISANLANTISDEIENTRLNKETQGLTKDLQTKYDAIQKSELSTAEKIMELHNLLFEINTKLGDKSMGSLTVVTQTIQQNNTDKENHT